MPARAVFERLRDVFDRADVDGDILADDAVAACGAAYQSAVLILQRDAQAVDLQLGDIGHRSLKIVQTAAKAVVERAQLVVVVRVVQAEHRLGMPHRGKAFGRASADALRRRIGCDEIRVIALELLELPQELVELGV